MVQVMSKICGVGKDIVLPEGLACWVAILPAFLSRFEYEGGKNLPRAKETPQCSES